MTIWPAAESQPIDVPSPKIAALPGSNYIAESTIRYVET